MSLANAKETPRGLVFNIQRYNLHDGDGIRTIVFFKGCGLRCKWCANPEGMRGRPQLKFSPEKCLRCGACAQRCESGACGFEDGEVRMRWELCRACGQCAVCCPPHAREMLGKVMSVDEVMKEVRRDAAFFRRSQGGLTLSGGEALAQREFACALLLAAKEEGLFTAVETCGCAPWAAFEEARAHTDLFLFDLKHMDSERHRELTGAGNEEILENARRLAEAGARIVFRTPVIPGLNDSEENIRLTARFAAETGAEGLELLPYHAMGVGKYARLGLAYLLEGMQPPEETHMALLREVVSEEMGKGF